MDGWRGSGRPSSSSSSSRSQGGGEDKRGGGSYHQSSRPPQQRSNDSNRRSNSTFNPATPEVPQQAPASNHQQHKVGTNSSSAVIKRGDLIKNAVIAEVSEAGLVAACYLPSQSPSRGGQAEEFYAIVKGFHHNRRTRSLFQLNDTIDLICTDYSPNEERVLNACPSPDFVRPLLILDINGVLGVRESYDASNQKKTRRFEVRPSTAAFLRFLRQRFEVAIWSAALPFTPLCRHRNMALFYCTGVAAHTRIWYRI